jgi:periplasmic divalent cation tolerance protein
MQKLIAVYTTLATREDARRIARHLVERRLAACAQITEIESFYRWKEEFVNEPEFRVLAKTKASCYPEIEAVIRSLHPYDLPAIHAVDVGCVYEPYGEWVVQNSSGAGDGSSSEMQ